jgi:5-methylcytosine-specific restriction endonuclease McrBC regulatory subunit McrC
MDYIDKIKREIEILKKEKQEINKKKVAELTKNLYMMYSTTSTSSTTSTQSTTGSYGTM